MSWQGAGRSFPSLPQPLLIGCSVSRQVQRVHFLVSHSPHSLVQLILDRASSSSVVAVTEHDSRTVVYDERLCDMRKLPQYFYMLCHVRHLIVVLSSGDVFVLRH